MTGCCSTPPYADVFTDKTARSDAARYRRRGLDALERGVVALVASRGLEGASVLEVGGGVGTLALELLRAGAARVTNVELSPAYEHEARSLLREHGLEERVDRRIGDLVREPSVPSADVVVLHKVVCCYPDGAGLIRAAAARTRRVLAITFPRTSWWVRLALVCVNVAYALRGSSYRAFVHSAQAVIGTATAERLRVAYDRQGILWRTVVLERTGGNSDAIGHRQRFDPAVQPEGPAVHRGGPLSALPGAVLTPTWRPRAAASSRRAAAPGPWPGP